MVNRARVIVLAAVLVGSSAHVSVTPLHAQYTHARRAACAGPEQGDSGAQYGVGYRYWVGQRLPQDDAEAGRWYRLAAARGHIEAQFQLGTMHLDPVHGPQAAEAVRWYRLAADQGNAGAQVSLGVMYGYRRTAGQGRAAAQFSLADIYELGLSVPQDSAEAVRWYRRAAQQGHADAQFALGDMYTSGHGVPQDDVQALMWLNLAAQPFQGEEDRDRSLKARDAIAGYMTADQIVEAQRRAREWTPTPEPLLSSSVPG